MLALSGDGVRALALALVCACAPGCLPSTITNTCEEIARKQCDQCTSCARESPRLEGAALCQLTRQEMQSCEQTLVARCEDQTTARQQPNEDLEACAEALDELTCEQLHESATLKRNPTVKACRSFL